MIEIRQYTTGDQEAVWELHNLALKGTGAHLGNGVWDADLKVIERVYLEDDGNFIVGVKDGQVLAMGALKKTNRIRAEIKRMRVHPDHQRRGYGELILQHLEADARQRSYKVLHLETTTLQIAAQKLYEKNGYKRSGGRVVGGLQTIIYEKRLD
jgi:ribosomal protein S18 acetylase RimI-like enzyme